MTPGTFVAESFGRMNQSTLTDAGDGNLHPLILFDERNEEELRRVHLAGSEIMKLCADAGGTISGEHGIGIEKKKEMLFVFTPQDIGAMKRVKMAFDPEDLYTEDRRE
jgi:glycolate oxidase